MWRSLFSCGRFKRFRELCFPEKEAETAYVNGLFVCEEEKGRLVNAEY